MRVYLLAKKLKVKSADVVDKLAMLKIEAVASSKIDSDTAKKVSLLVKQPLRVEDVATELDLSVEKFLKKLKTMKIEVISHLSLLHEDELIRLFKLKTLEKLKDKPSVAKLSAQKPLLKVVKMKAKKQRVFEVAAELGVSESALLKKLRQMNILALHRRSPLDRDIIERLKTERYRLLDKVVFRIVHFFEELPELLESLKRFSTSTVFYMVIISLLALLAFSNTFVIKAQYEKQNTWAIEGSTINKSAESYQVLETVALLEIKKFGLKFPIVEEGKDNSPITAVLSHKSTTVMPGAEGTSLLVDKQGVVSKKLAAVQLNEIFSVTDVDGNKYYYRVVNEAAIKNVKKNSYKSMINILLKGRKIVAVLQKVE